MSTFLILYIVELHWSRLLIKTSEISTQSYSPIKTVVWRLRVRTREHKVSSIPDSIVMDTQFWGSPLQERTSRFSVVVWFRSVSVLNYIKLSSKLLTYMSKKKQTTYYLSTKSTNTWRDINRYSRFYSLINNRSQHPLVLKSYHSSLISYN